MNKFISYSGSIFLCPDRIMVLHQIANLDPSGCAGSIPAQGVVFKMTQKSFSEKCYDLLSKVPEGKNITWNKIITKYLTTSKGPDQLAQDYTVRCPVCGLEYECPKCGRKYKL